MTNATPIATAVLIAELVPTVAFAFASEHIGQIVRRWPAPVRILCPAVLVIPYIVIAAAQHTVHIPWMLLYAGLPIVMAWLLERARTADPDQRGNWRDALILLTLGLSVDLRWFDPAWPRGWEGLGKLLLVNAGLYGFLAIRGLTGTGFDFRLQWSDWKTGMRELFFFAPAVLALGFVLRFIHPHANWPPIWKALGTWGGIFVFVAVPEELFFRAWVQNLLERRVGRHAALIIASVLFGLSHFNKRSAHFNWRYVILATIAGIFYGRAWRENRRVPASTITHTFVDWLWSWWF